MRLGWLSPCASMVPARTGFPTMRSIATAMLKIFSSTHGQTNSPTLFFTKWELAQAGVQ